MKTACPARNRFRIASQFELGFTLIELLVVITILGVLMGLAVGGTGAIKEQARTAQAKNDCTGLAVAVKAFYADYSRYPISADNAADVFVDPSGGAGGGDSGKDSQATNKSVMDVLTASESVINPRGTVYYEAKRASNPSSSSSSGQTGSTAASSTGSGPRGGLWNGSMYDPWGVTYGFAFDGDYDGKLVYSGGSLKDLDDNARIIGGGAGVFSLGPRQKKSIYSW